MSAYWMWWIAAAALIAAELLTGTFYLLAVGIAVVAVVTPASGGSGIERGKLEGSLATAFAHLYRVQTRQLHRPDVTEAQLRAAATCDKGGGLVPDNGPGNGWRCGHQ